MRSISLQELLEAGCHFGHQVRRWNPKMKKYVFGERDHVHIFDLAKTKEGLEDAYKFLRDISSEGKKVLFVGTKRQAAATVKAAANKTGMPFITKRWMGGLLTNFSQISKSIRRLSDLKSQRETGELKKYTKKEQLLIDREIEKLEKFFGGVAEMDKLPDAVFIVDTHREDVAVREAVRMGVPVVGMVDSNGDPEIVDYVIPVNDDAVKSIELVVNLITDAVEEGIKRGKEAEAKSDGAEVQPKLRTKTKPKTKKVEKNEV